MQSYDVIGSNVGPMHMNRGHYVRGVTLADDPVVFGEGGGVHKALRKDNMCKYPPIGSIIILQMMCINLLK